MKTITIIINDNNEKSNSEEIYSIDNLKKEIDKLEEIIERQEKEMNERIAARRKKYQEECEKERREIEEYCRKIREGTI